MAAKEAEAERARATALEAEAAAAAAAAAAASPSITAMNSYEEEWCRLKCVETSVESAWCL